MHRVPGDGNILQPSVTTWAPICDALFTKTHGHTLFADCVSACVVIYRTKHWKNEPDCSERVRLWPWKQKFDRFKKTEWGYNQVKCAAPYKQRPSRTSLTAFNMKQVQPAVKYVFEAEVICNFNQENKPFSTAGTSPRIFFRNSET